MSSAERFRFTRLEKEMAVGFVAFVLVLVAVAVIVPMVKRSRGLNRMASVQASATTDYFPAGTVQSPLDFSRICGRPDHVRKSNGALIWVYEPQKVMVTFVKDEKSVESYRLFFNVFDPIRYAEWGEVGRLSKDQALGQIGCNASLGK